MFGASSDSIEASADKLNKKITIIIPCYNSEKYIQDCFESVKNQTIGIQCLQVIFVNDASTDHTVECLQDFKQEYPESVEIINLKQNHRQGGARNRGLMHAVGEYVLFLDSDDWLDVSMCEKVYQKATAYDIDILQFPFIHVYGENNCHTDSSIYYGLLVGTEPEIRSNMLIGSLFTFGSQNKLYRRTFLEQQKAAFPEGVVYEEPYFVYPLLFTAERFYSMEEGLYYYRQTGQSVTLQHMNEKYTLYDHPFVQLELLKKIISETEYVKEYYSEIEFHFLYSYYIETLYFAGRGNKYLGADYFLKMQRIVLELFPAYKENPYLQIEGFEKYLKVLLSLEQQFNQKELNQYCRQVVDIINLSDK